jgi:poly(3-hydroxybutyrate) depolymerase
MTAVMLATYPDLFEAGAIMAGLPYECATSQTDAYSCMNPGKDKAPSAWGALVPKVAGASAPRVSIWHGDADYTVRPSNLEQLVRQWTDVNGIADKPAATSTVGKAKHEEYTDASGVVRVESWTISGMSHGVSVDPKGGCGTAGAYVIDEGLCSTRHAAAFFGLIAPDAATGGGGSSGSSGGASGGASSGGASSGTSGFLPSSECP